MKTKDSGTRLKFQFPNPQMGLYSFPKAMLFSYLLLPGGVTVAQWALDPFVEVRILTGQPRQN